jgi:hypothetical protein
VYVRRPFQQRAGRPRVPGPAQPPGQPAQHQPAHRQHHEDDGEDGGQRADGVLGGLTGTGHGAASTRERVEGSRQLVSDHRHVLRDAGRGLHVPGDRVTEGLDRAARFGQHEDRAVDGAREEHPQQDPGEHADVAASCRERWTGCWA